MKPLLAVALLATACGSATSTSASGDESRGTISGTVFRAPTCPVEKLNSPCPPSRVKDADVEIERGTSTVARTTTDDAGAFTVAVAPRTYTVVATNTGGLARTAHATVVVTQGRRRP